MGKRTIIFRSLRFLAKIKEYGPQAHNLRDLWHGNEVRPHFSLTIFLFCGKKKKKKNLCQWNHHSITVTWAIVNLPFKNQRSASVNKTKEKMTFFFIEIVGALKLQTKHIYIYIYIYVRVCPFKTNNPSQKELNFV